MKNSYISKKDDVIKGRCLILAEIVNAIKKIYKSSNNNQRAFIETIIGAAIWYIPKPKDFWSGMISINTLKDALKNFKEDKKFKLSEEHKIPRKYAAKELLIYKNKLTLEYVKKEYELKYCKLHYVTSKENKDAILYQKNFDGDSEKVYKNAGIQLIKINKEILKLIKQGNIECIEKLINSHNCT